MPLFVIVDSVTPHKAEADRLTILKDGSARLHTRNDKGRWVCVGAVKADEWDQIYVAHQPAVPTGSGR